MGYKNTYPWKENKMLKHKVLIATLAGLLPIAATASVQSNLSSNINKAKQSFAASE